MIDIWFKKDLTDIFDNHPIAVFIDESGEAEFLLQTVKSEYIIYRPEDEVEELRVKYLIEKAQPSNEKFLIYTQLKKDELKFIREYCETCGSLEIRYLQNYIKDKVHQSLNININLSKERLITAAKVSIGKDQTYWMDLSHKGSAEIFNLEKELLPFVHDPTTYSKKSFDAQLLETFYREVNELLDIDYIPKPATTLASEVVESMFDGLAKDDCNKTLYEVYENWLDSVTYKQSFNGYLDKYTLPTDIGTWDVNVNHPFRQVDERWLADMGARITDKDYISDILPTIRQRHQSKQAKALEILFWSDVITILEFDSKNINYLSSFSECIDYYRKSFFKLDTAIRNLYTEFLNNQELLEPFQELYKEYLSIFLEKWFEYWGDYKENQTGTLQRIIDENDGIKTAVIVGDGVAYELAEQVASKVRGSENLKKDVILADIPTETENNMSRIYMDNGVIEAVQSNREKYLLSQNPDLSIDFLRLDEVSGEAKTCQFLICTYKDIDDMGEKLQQKALKYLPETIDFFATKISHLLSSGYEKVYLISDHGFVLTGLLTEADKISFSPNVVFEKAERYIRTESKLLENTASLIEAKKSYKQYEYLYFAKNINPFKTPGLYGYSHGGLSPQEIVTPYFCWERSATSAASLSVKIENKEDLKDVTGELFSVKIQAEKGEGDLFSLDRKVYLAFFANKQQFNKSDIFTIQRNELITKDYSFDGNSEIEIQLLDAMTKKQLDRAIVKQNNARDLGGLF